MRGTLSPEHGWKQLTVIFLAALIPRCSWVSIKSAVNGHLKLWRRFTTTATATATATTTTTTTTTTTNTTTTNTRVLLPCTNQGFCQLNLTGITKLKLERKLTNEYSGRICRSRPIFSWYMLKRVSQLTRESQPRSQGFSRPPQFQREIK